VIKIIEINPNPFVSTIQLKAIGYNETVRVQLYDAVGRLVKDESSVLTNPSLTKIGVPFLAAGCYVIKVITSDGVISKQLLKVD
jgi:hypothetical protein